MSTGRTGNRYHGPGGRHGSSDGHFNRQELWENTTRREEAKEEQLKRACYEESEPCHADTTTHLSYKKDLKREFPSRGQVEKFIVAIFWGGGFGSSSELEEEV